MVDLMNGHADAVSGSLYRTVFARDEPWFDPSQVDWALIMKFHLDGKCLTAACLTWVLYDWVLTFEESVTLFWMSRWTTSKVLFLVNRYISIAIMADIALLIFFPSPSLNNCIKGAWTELICAGIIIMIVNFMMASRAYALWGLSPIILTILLIFCLGNIGTYFSLNSLALQSGIVVSNQPPFTGCLVLPIYPKIWLNFFVSLLFETITITLIVIKSFPMARQRDIRTPLFTVMLEDGLGYYLGIMTAQLMTLVCIYVPSSLGPPLATAYLPVPVSCIAINRAFLHLQKILVNEDGLPQTGSETGDFATTGRYGTNDDGNTTGLDTIGQSNSAGRRRRHRYPQRRRDQEESDWDIELSSQGVNPTLEKSRQVGGAFAIVSEEVTEVNPVAVPLGLESNPRNIEGKA